MSIVVDIVYALLALIAFCVVVTALLSYALRHHDEESLERDELAQARYIAALRGERR